ncbi:MAG: hypothetical protein IJ645_08025 [Ruminococcus sp.]|nr:hypothetical protein [Ruminococcus sp.]
MILKRIFLLTVLTAMAVSMSGCGDSNNKNESRSASRITANTATENKRSNQELKDENNNSNTDEADSDMELTADFRFVGTSGYPAVLKNNGDLYVWPAEIVETDDGQWFDTTTTYELTYGEVDNAPYLILSDVKEFVSDLSCYYAITNDDTLYGWGSYYVGCGDFDGHLEPVKILDDVKTVGHCFAITNGGELYVWGDNKTSSEEQPSPQKVLDNIKSFKQNHIYENDTYVCMALTNDGDLYSWGTLSSDRGVEDGETYVPNYVMSGVRDYSPSEGFAGRPAVALTENDELYIWGLFETSIDDGDIKLIDHGDLENAQRTPIKVMDNVKTLCTNKSVDSRFSDEIRFISNDNKGYKFEKADDSIILNHYLDDVAEIGNKNYYIKTDGTLVVYKVVYNNCKLGVVDNSDSIILIDEEEHKMRIANSSDSHSVIPKLDNVVDAGSYFAVTNDNKLYFWENDNGAYVHSRDGGGYYEQKVVGPVEISIP